jgi:hypothetical protein
MAKRTAAHKAHSMNTLTKRTILLMIAIVVSGCANHREARRKSVQLYPGLPQREVVSLFGMPNKAEGNPDEGNPSGDYDEHRQGSAGNSHFQQACRGGSWVHTLSPACPRAELFDGFEDTDEQVLELNDLARI